MEIKDEIVARLQQAFTPHRLEVINESALHAGHREAGESIDSHFRIKIAAQSLQGLSRVAQHKEIYHAMGELINNPIHALAIEVNRVEE